MNTKDQVVAVAGFSIDPVTGLEHCVAIEWKATQVEAEKLFDEWAERNPRLIPSFKPIWLH